LNRKAVGSLDFDSLVESFLALSRKDQKRFTREVESKAKISIAVDRSDVATRKSRSLVVVDTPHKKPKDPDSAHPRQKPGSRDVRDRLGVTQSLFAQLMGVTDRTVSSWETGATAMPQAARRRLAELDRLASALHDVMNPAFIPTWLTTPNEAMRHRSPLQLLELGESTLFWQCVDRLGSGLPI
jgi:transcriptional regulator with XRE-family HTH domain